MYRTQFELFYSWLIAQKGQGQWDSVAEYFDNRISTEKDHVMTLLGSLSRENTECINSLIECKARIELLEHIRDLPSLSAKEIAEHIDVK